MLLHFSLQDLLIKRDWKQEEVRLLAKGVRILALTIRGRKERGNRVHTVDVPTTGQVIVNTYLRTRTCGVMTVNLLPTGVINVDSISPTEGWVSSRLQAGVVDAVVEWGEGVGAVDVGVGLNLIPTTQSSLAMSVD